MRASVKEARLAHNQQDHVRFVGHAILYETLIYCLRERKNEQHIDNEVVFSAVSYLCGVLYLRGQLASVSLLGISRRLNRFCTLGDAVSSEIKLFNMDCMTAMRDMPDKAFDLAIVDPPYGIGDRLSDGGGKLKNTPMAVLYRNSKKWDVIPNDKYFKELFRISENQIIWGGNYFGLPASRCMLAWDKLQHMTTLSAWEMGWTSFDKPSKIFRHSSMNINRFHPTQKPVALYKWLLKNYAKPGFKILDTHLGSGSIAIACYDMGYDLTGYEIDLDYYNAAVKRLNNHKKQLTFI